LGGGRVGRRESQESGGERVGSQEKYEVRSREKDIKYTKYDMRFTIWEEDVQIGRCADVQIGKWVDEIG
jgi:hypothetical protein